jgi:hypothetical protein
MWLADDAWAQADADPQASAEFKVQGEYLGTVKGEDGDVATGVQVIALGDGRFRGVGYIGGLPGAGWAKGDERHEVDGVLEDGVLVLRGDESMAELREGALHIVRGGEKVGELRKVERTSPTLGAKPPEGAIVLFDGSSTDAWENGQIIEGSLLRATNVASKRRFGDHQLHIEFRTPFMPKARGQGRGNSGVYVQSRYEVQVLDSFGLLGRNNECGGIYSIAEPAVNMCLPPMAWQTYDIDFTAARYDSGNKVKNARITVRHNGVVIHDDVELTQGTPGRHREGPEPDALFLQDHENPVAFRNIWVIER